MSNGKNPLMLMMALSMPGAGHALGLGDIHVDSGLNERLAAEIDIVGATPLDLIDLRAAVANRETFLRYGAERPSFLSSTTFKVTEDSQGRPVLAVRSTDSFTEPAVNLLVDLHWSHGELVRQYTLLLDPAGFASALPASIESKVPAAPSIPAVPTVPAAPPVGTPIAESKIQTVARQADPPAGQPDADAERTVRKTTHIKVGPKATLRGVAWRVGERSESDLQRMMIAIFRANPNAFDGNINRLHRGAVLTIPSRAEAAAISQADAKREVHAQMTTWRARTIAARSAVAATGAVTPNGAVMANGAATATPSAPGSNAAVDKPSDTAEAESLGRRVQSLEQTLSEMKGVLESERVQLLDLQRQAASADKPAADASQAISAPQDVNASQAISAPQDVNASQAISASQAVNAPQTVGASQAISAPQTVGAVHAQPARGYTAPVTLVAGLGLLSAALAAIYGKFRRRASMPTLSPNEGVAVAAGAAPVDAAAVDAVTADGTADALHDDARGQGQTSAKDPVQDTAQIRAADDTLANAGAPAAAADGDSTHPLLPALAEPAGRSEIAATASRALPHDPTVNLHLDTVNLRMDQTQLDYNFLDLDV